jgi:NADPH:quinone reductase-like Zn-dependent oxidoreductase
MDATSNNSVAPDDPSHQPGTMKAVVANSFGKAEDVLSVDAERPRPRVEPGSKKVLIRVKACALSPGDWRTLHGDADLVRHPPFPYVPAHDICGTVVELDPSDNTGIKFKVGDEVVATWSEIALGGLAEYALADASRTVLKPPRVSAAEGAAAANSAGHALRIVREKGRVQAGERVLVLGASGGVGTALVQLVKQAGASYIAATSTQEQLMRSLGADEILDYRSRDWWTVEEFKTNQFDVIFDLVEGAAGWERAKSSGVLKRGVAGGRFVAVTMMNPRQPFHTVGDMAGFMSGILWRWTWTRVASLCVPLNTPVLSGVDGETLTEVLAAVDAGRLKVVLDPRSPFPFTLEGVVAAFQLQDSMHAHGKVVIQVSDDK